MAPAGIFLRRKLMAMTEKLRCIIIEDDPLSAEILTVFVERTPFLTLTGTYNNPLDAMPALTDNTTELIITDINMPHVSGVQFAKSVNKQSLVIFVSASPEYAVDGFELNVVDYLLKPIAFDRFLQACQKALLRHKSNSSATAPAPALQEAAPATANDFLFVKVNGKIVRVDIKDILYVEAKKEYVLIVTLNGKKLLTMQSMQNMQNLLDKKGFVRVHKSFIVAVDKIDEIERNLITIQQTTIPVGESYKSRLLEVINQ
jgi:two-component system LytT family response regulator